MNFLQILAEFGDAASAGKTAVHSGNMGDVLYSLPAAAALGVGRVILNLVEDPGVGGRRLDRAGAEFLVPLLLARPGIRSVAIAAAPAELAVLFGLKDGEKLVSRGLPLERVEASALGVDYCLDRFRLMPAAEMHLIEAHARAMGVTVDGRPPFLTIADAEPADRHDAILLSLTPRYRHLPATFFAELLDGLAPIRLIGRPEEQHVYRGISGTFVTCRDGLELARMIAGSRLFIGTPSLPYAIAEGLKAKRVVDVPAWPLNAFPLGADGWMLPTDLRAARLLIRGLLERGRPPSFSGYRPVERPRPVEADPASHVLELQIAWSSGDAFNPEDARLEGIALDRPRRLVRVEIPPLPSSVRTIGLGLSGYNGWLGVSTMHVSDAKDQILWCADATDLLHATVDIPAITLRPSEDAAEVLWDQFNPGAHLRLPLPRDRLSALDGGGNLTFMLRMVPSERWPALYRSLKSTANDLARQIQGHAQEMVAAETDVHAAQEAFEQVVRNAREAQEQSAHHASVAHEHIAQLTEAIKSLEEGRLHERQHHQQQIEAFLHSSSWRVTSPLRAATRLLGEIRTTIRARAKAAFARTTPSAVIVPPVAPAPSVQTVPPAIAPAPAELVVVAPADPPEETAREIWIREGRLDLEALLGSGERLDFRIAAAPRISIVLVLYNQAHLTLGCLRSIQVQAGAPCDLVIVDNASSDETHRLLERIDGATILKNDRNEGFLNAVNQAAQVAKAPFLLLLNNDARLLRGTLLQAVYRLQDEPDVGAIGGQIVLPDGLLQEAGSIIWSDGSCLGYGRGASPTAPEFMFTRDVDYVSGAFLLTRTALFRKLGGFDPAFVPAYYEETDYCMRLRAAGHRVVYDPRIQILHYEFGSAAHPAEALQLQREHQVVFRRRYRDVLTRAHLRPEEGNVVFARARPPRCGRVLVIDDRVPDPSQGAGFPRAATILRLIEAQGHFVTHYPLRASHEDWSVVYRTLPRTVEVMLGLGASGLAAFLRSRVGYYSAVIISRPHNMVALQGLLAEEPGLLGDARVIYDAEAVFALREKLQAEALGVPWTEIEAEERIGRELGLADRADTIIAVSRYEAAQFSSRGHKDVRILGHAVELRPTPTALEDRRSLLFVGRLEEDGSPNVDAVLWFVDQVMPVIANRLGWMPPLTLAGRHGAASLQRLSGNPTVRFVGSQPDLEPLYASSRLFIAPSRFASGIPHKIHEAAAHGLPCVVSPVLADQLDWRDGDEVLVGMDASGFADACIRLLRDDRLWHDIRDRALIRLATDCSEHYFQETLAGMLADIGCNKAAPDSTVDTSSVAAAQTSDIAQ